MRTPALTGDPRSDSSQALAAGLVSDQVLGHPIHRQRVCCLLRAFPGAPPLSRRPTTRAANQQLADPAALGAITRLSDEGFLPSKLSGKRIGLGDQLF